MKRWLWRGALAIALLGILGFVVAASGVVPIKASSGHWAITAALLDFSKQRSVSTHTIGVEAPQLDDPRMIARGGAYYDLGCRPCHGAPQMRQPRIAVQMTPHPVELPARINNWQAAELFYMVKHGIKFTGMPAWPGRGRDDEVWAIVAFLRRLPQLDSASYTRIARGEAADDPAGRTLRGLEAAPDSARRAVVENCSRCHGPDGWGRDGAAPAIAGQRVGYLIASLNAFAHGRRHSGMMEPSAASLSEETTGALAYYYAGLAPRSASAVSAAHQRGEVIANHGVPEKKVPACGECHGPGEHRRNPIYPNLAGQYAEYLILQLQLFKAGKRGGTRYAHLMQHVAPHLSEAQIRDVAAYYSAINGKSLSSRN